MAIISIEKISVKAFIQEVLINNIENLVNTGNHYLGFGTLTQAIELLGAIIEDKEVESSQNSASEFHTRNKSRKRFCKSLSLFSDPRYIHYCPECKNDTTFKSNYDLYDNLRCGFAHQMKPTGNIALTTLIESYTDGTAHLEIDPKSGNLIIVSEILYRDLKETCEKIIEMIDNGQINHTKPYGDFISVLSYEESN